MTALAAVRAQLVTAIQAQVPTVQVSGVPFGEDTALKEAIWVERAESEFEWRSLGGTGADFRERNRIETILIELRVHVYREAPDQTDASDAAIDRAEVLLAEIEDAIETDFSIGNTLTHALISRWSLEPQPREDGWAVLGRATFEGKNYPG
jgi:sensor domain CHASE-containing protein